MFCLFAPCAFPVEKRVLPVVRAASSHSFDRAQLLVITDCVVGALLVTGVVVCFLMSLKVPVFPLNVVGSDMLIALQFGAIGSIALIIIVDVVRFQRMKKRFIKSQKLPTAKEPAGAPQAGVDKNPTTPPSATANPAPPATAKEAPPLGTEPPSGPPANPAPPPPPLPPTGGSGETSSTQTGTKPLPPVVCGISNPGCHCYMNALAQVMMPVFDAFFASTTRDQWIAAHKKKTKEELTCTLKKAYFKKPDLLRPLKKYRHMKVEVLNEAIGYHTQALDNPKVWDRYEQEIATTSDSLLYTAILGERDVASFFTNERLLCSSTSPIPDVLPKTQEIATFFRNHFLETLADYYEALKIFDVLYNLHDTYQKGKDAREHVDVLVSLLFPWQVLSEPNPAIQQQDSAEALPKILAVLGMLNATWDNELIVFQDSSQPGAHAASAVPSESGAVGLPVQEGIPLGVGPHPDGDGISQMGDKSATGSHKELYHSHCHDMQNVLQVHLPDKLTNQALLTLIEADKAITETKSDRREYFKFRATNGEKQYAATWTSTWTLTDQPPQYLMVQLVRFRGGAGKILGDVPIPEDGILDLGKLFLPWPVDSRMAVPSQPYRIVGIVRHNGDTLTCGHYDACSQRQGKWYRFDDAKPMVSFSGVSQTYAYQEPENKWNYDLKKWVPSQTDYSGYLFLLERMPENVPPIAT